MKNPPRLDGGRCYLGGCRSEFHCGVFDGEAHVAVGFCKATNGFRLVDSGFKHDQGDRHATACRLDDVDSLVTADMAGTHEDADAALDQLRVLHVYVDHEVFVHVAETRHRAGGDHVGDHLLRRGSLHAG